MDKRMWSLMDDDQIKRWCPDASFGSRCVLPLDHAPEDIHYYNRGSAVRDGWAADALRPQEDPDWCLAQSATNGRPCQIRDGHLGVHVFDREAALLHGWGEDRLRPAQETNVTWCATNGVATGRACFLPEGHKGAHIYVYGRAIDGGWTPDQLRPMDEVTATGDQSSRCPRTGGPGETRCTLARGHTTVCMWGWPEPPAEVAKTEPPAEPDVLYPPEAACGEPDPRFVGTVCALAKGHDGDHSNEDSLTAAELRIQSEDRATRIHKLEQDLHRAQQGAAATERDLTRAQERSEDLRKQRNLCAARIVELERSEKKLGETNQVLQRQVEELQSALKKAREESGDLSERNTKLCRELENVRDAAARTASENRRLHERVDQLEQSEAKLNDTLTKVNTHYAAMDAQNTHVCPPGDHTECRLLASRLRRALNALLDDD